MDQQQILQFIRSKGPILPVQLASEIKQNIIITGAVLSELAKSGHILISNTKVGGSPVYYVKEHTYRLQDLYKNLNEKDKRAYDLLKQRKILRDKQLTPLLRVSLRNIKDFAKPIEVQTGQGNEIFWRWFMTPMQDAQGEIQNYFQPPEVKPEPKAPEPSTPEVTNAAPRVQAPVQPEEKPLKAPVQQETLQGEISDPLHEKTKRFFKSKDINVLDVEIVRKKKEIDYIIEMPTPLGSIQYFCKAKVKKKNTEGDIAQVFVKGQSKKLPVLYLSTGDLTKKAKNAIGKDYKNLIFKKLG